MKKPVKIIVIALVFFVVLNVLKNGLIQAALSAGASKAAHAPVRIGSTNARLLATAITLKNVRVQNPSGFPDKWMVDMPQIAMDVEASDLFKGQIHFEEIRLDLRELTVVKNREGKMNVDAVKPTPKEKQEVQEAKEAKKKEPGKKPKLKIDKLYLTIGRVVYKDYSGGGEPHIQTFEIGIKDRLYTDIENPAAVASLIMFEALTRTTLSRLADLDVGEFKEGAIGAITEGLGIAKEGTNAIEDTARSVFGSLFK